MNSTDITVIIHSYNDQKNIVDCIKSADLLSDQIVVIDMYSNDRTADLAKQNSAKVYFYPKSNYVEPARQFGIEKAKTDYIFLLDSDERITTELANEIKSVISSQYSVVSQEQKLKTDNRKLTTHFRVPRKNIFGRIKWLKHGGWWPDYQVRLINKKYFKIWPKEIHSTPVIEGKIGYLKNSLTHYFHGDLESMVNKTIIFEDIESELLSKAKKTVNTATFFRKYFGELYKRLFKGLGFLDGEIGIIESVYQAFSKTITYIYLYEKRRTLRSLS